LNSGGETICTLNASGSTIAGFNITKDSLQYGKTGFYDNTHSGIYIGRLGEIFTGNQYGYGIKMSYTGNMTIYSPTIYSGIEIKNGNYKAEISPRELSIDGKIYGQGLYISNTSDKSKYIETDYGTKLVYCYELTSPMFGDIGTATLNNDGIAIVDIDPIFQEYISLKCEYYVFLQNEGKGSSYISEKDSTYFIISGTPGLKVAWELKARQIGSQWKRSEDFDHEYIYNEPDYAEEAFKDVMNYLDGGTE
jgi:hypothetical protein